MRKLFWFGCAASVTAAAFVFVTARHAHKHPASIAGHLVRGAYVATGWSNPVLQACRSMGAKLAFTVGRTLAPETVQTPCQAAPCCTSTVPDAAPACCEIPQVIDLTTLSPDLDIELPVSTIGRYRPGFIPPSVEGELERELEWMQQQQTGQVAPVTVIVTPGDGEEADAQPVPTTMPPAAEDENNACRQLKDGDLWQEFFEVKHKDATDVELLPMPRELGELPEATDAGAEADGIEQGEPADCKETPEIDQHNSGCPSMGGCPYTGRSPTPPPSYPTGKDRE